MPRSGGGIYSKPAGTTAVPNTTIESSKYNSTIDDLVTDANAARPISAGGTGSTTAADARTALGISATNTPFTPTGAIAATNVQTALAELDTEKATASLYAPLAGATFTGAIAGTTASFSSVVSGANASADGHLLNRITADGRFQPILPLTWTDITSAATMDVGAVASANLRVTGTTTVTSLGTAASGVTRTLRAAAAFTLTHSANIVCPASTSLVLAADDFIRVSSLGGGVWHVTDTRLGADRSALDGVLGYRLRAAANFSGVAVTGTYSRTGTLVTVTITAHGMTTGQVVNLDFTTGTATDGTYTVTVTGVDTFTVNDTVSGATSGNVTRQIFIRSSFNISSITDNGIGDYTLNFTSAMPDANFCFQMTASDNGTGTGGPAQTNGFAYGSWVRGSNSTGYATGSMRFQIGYPATADLYDQTHINVAIFR